MILPFSKRFPETLHRKPTGFAPKIMKGLILNDLATEDDLANYVWSLNKEGLVSELFSGFMHFNPEYIKWTDNPDIRPKIHTVRQDQKNRWQKDKKIHAVMNSRTPDQIQFVPELICQSTQKFEVKGGLDVDMAGNKVTMKHYFIDGRELSPDEVLEFARNDGFDSPDDFNHYFPIGFTGKVIHWTNRKY